MEIAAGHIDDEAISDVVALQSLEGLVRVIHLHHLDHGGHPLGLAELQHLLSLLHAPYEAPGDRLPPCTNRIKEAVGAVHINWWQWWQYAGYPA